MRGHILGIESGEIHAPRYVVVNPVWVPPFLRIDLYAVELHRKMDVIAASHAGLPAKTHHLALLH